MGAYSPAPIINEKLETKIKTRIIQPLIEGLHKEQAPYKGVLYVGLMIVDNEPYVLEFNVRFGDPETQVILPRIKSDLVEIIEASLDENIKELRVGIDKRTCLCVVCASAGYPGNYRKNLPIDGLDSALKMNNVMIFHAGTKITQHATRNTCLTDRQAQYETSGGRVLGVTSIAANIKDAIDDAYKAVSLISFNGMQYRKDIGFKAIEKIKS